MGNCVSQILSEFFQKTAKKASGLLSTAVIKCHGQKSIRRGKGLFHFTAYIPYEGKSGQEPGRRNWRQELGTGTGGRNWGQELGTGTGGTP